MLLRFDHINPKLGLVAIAHTEILTITRLPADKTPSGKPQNPERTAISTRNGGHFIVSDYPHAVVSAQVLAEERAREYAHLERIATVAKQTAAT